MTFISERDLDELDRIERSVDIDATRERVWSVVSVPGWWINEGEITDNEVHEEDDGVYRVVHASYGAFRIRLEEADEPSYLRFGWVGGGAGEQTEGPDTTVEFFLVERPGGTRLRVVEAGFTTRDPARRRWLSHREENVSGWDTELAAARRRITGVR